MKKLIILLSLFFLLSCTTKVEDDFIIEEVKEIDIPQVGYTTIVSEEYREEAKEKGTIEEVIYDSKDYLNDNKDIKKVAYVYLPYGYDEDDKKTRYDIVYLMHGWNGHAGEYFDYTPTKNVFDNMIEKGDIKPIIIVSATFYNENSKDDFDSSVEELRLFHHDFIDNLMPTIESKYKTYAKSTSKEDLIASRDHRTFGGFSLGSVTTWLEFCYDHDYIRNYIPMSASCWYYGNFGEYYPKETADFFEEIIKDKYLNERGYYIYATVGTLDPMMSEVDYQMNEMLSRDMFDNKHVVYYKKENGIHDFVAVQEFLYNAFMVLFSQSN